MSRWPATDAPAPEPVRCRAVRTGARNLLGAGGFRAAINLGFSRGCGVIGHVGLSKLEAFFGVLFERAEQFLVNEALAYGALRRRQA